MDDLNKGLAGKDKELGDLKDKLKGAEDELGGLKDQLADSKGKLDALEDGLADRDGALGKLRDKLKGKQDEIEGLKDQLADSNDKLGDLGDDIDKKLAALKDLEGKLKKKDNELGDLADKLARNNDDKDKLADLLSAETARCDANENLLAKESVKVKECEDDRIALNAAYAADKDTLSVLPKKLKEIDKLKDELQNKDDLIAKLKKQLDAPKHQLAYQPNSKVKPLVHQNENLPTPEQMEVLRKVIDAMRKNGANVSQNQQTGALVLELDDSFYFTNNSAVLNTTSKKKIAELIPPFLTSIFGNESVRSKIKGLNITGHTSPIYRKKFVSPEDTGSRAYQYNLKLSKERSESVRNFIVGKEIGKFKYKDQLSNFDIRVEGMSYRQPILATKDTSAEDRCEQYDCRRSRRVEITFVFAE